jgi:LemA protein
MNIYVIIVLVVLVILGLWALLAYNAFVRLKNQVKNAWAQIDVQLKRRADLIPNLVETVKGYVKHEKGTLENVTKARTAIMQAGSNPKLAAKADNLLSGALKSLFAVAESYPQLKANENFLQLQEELSGTESKVAASRQYYNDMVMEYNTKREVFPSSVIANIFNFEEKELFQATESEKAVPKVQF